MRRAEKFVLSNQMARGASGILHSRSRPGYRSLQDCSAQLCISPLRGEVCVSMRVKHFYCEILKGYQKVQQMILKGPVYPLQAL